MADKWIQGAIKHKGAATAKAKAENLPVHEWAAKHKDDKDLTGKQARLALTLHEIGEEKDDGDEKGETPAPSEKPGGMRSFY